MTRRAIITVPAILAGAVLLAACGGAGGSSGSGAGTTGVTSDLRVALDWVPNTNHSGIYVAQAKGWFAKEGIHLTLLPYGATSPDVLVAEGKADLGISFPPQLAVERAQGLPVKAVAAVLQRNEDAIAVLASSRFHRPRDLSGPLTYLGFGSPAENAVVSAVIRADGGRPAFRQATLQTDAYEALYAGKGDFSQVFLGWEPFQARLRTPPVRLRTFPIRRYLGARDTWPSVVIVASDSGIRSNAGVLRRGLAAMAEGYRFASRQPAATARILERADSALARTPRLVAESARYLAPSYVTASGAWGPMRPSQFAGISRLLANAGALKTADHHVVRSLPASQLFTNRLLGGG